MSNPDADCRADSGCVGAGNNTTKKECKDQYGKAANIWYNGNDNYTYEACYNHSCIEKKTDKYIATDGNAISRNKDGTCAYPHKNPQTHYCFIDRPDDGRDGAAGSSCPYDE